jgi:folate-binding protein YgfZ
MSRFALNRTLIEVTGADTRAFLQGLLTQDLDRLDAAPVTYAALLSPQGKVSADMLVWARGDGVVLDVDRTRGEALARKLAMYKLRSAVTLRDVSDTHQVLVSDAMFDGATADPRLADLGFRAIAPRGDAADGAAWFGARCLKLGVPDLARDAGVDEVFGLEALLEELNGVDFKKGCFVGQENVSRMKRRATTRKKFCPITFDGAAPAPAPGASVKAGEVELGTVRGGGDGRAMALLRLDRALEAEQAGKILAVGDLAVRLDPPAWLILPPREAHGD